MVSRVNKGEEKCTRLQTLCTKYHDMYDRTNGILIHDVMGGRVHSVYQLLLSHLGNKDKAVTVTCASSYS